jgi:hypothetical protein
MAKPRSRSKPPEKTIYHSIEELPPRLRALWDNVGRYLVWGDEAHEQLVGAYDTIEEAHAVSEAIQKTAPPHTMLGVIEWAAPIPVRPLSNER